MANRADQPPWLKDGQLSFSGGVDQTTPPNDIDADQCARLVNATCRNGKLSPRPAWKKRELTFADQVDGPFKFSNFQEGYFYDGNGVPALLSSHGGRQFKIDLRNFQVSEITPIKSYATEVITSGFVVPAAAATVLVNVESTAHMTLQQPNITIDGNTLIITEIQSATVIIVENDDAAQAGNAVAIADVVSFVGFDPNNPLKKKNWSRQAENYWILQDNQSYPIIFDGSKAFRSDPAKNQIPVGNVMAYVQGRLAVALPGRQTYSVGDIIFGQSGTIVNDGRDAILYFTENMYLNEGGDFIARVFGAPSNAGDILAMQTGNQSDTSLGQGPMLVGSQNIVFSVNLPFDRTIWKNLANALQTANPIIGMTGQDTTIAINTDIWYRSLDGIRSYITAQRQFNGSWANTPMSSEVDEVLSADTDHWLEWGSAVLFDNRLLTTVSPQRSPNGYYHRGLVALDFNLTSGMRHKTGPAWEGVWTGLRILKIVAGLVNKKPRCFMYVLNDTSEIELWELTTDEKYDNGADRIEWSADLRSMNCGNSDAFKKLETARMIFTELSGTLDCTVQYRTDEAPCWYDWKSFTRCAKDKDCGPFACTGPVTYQPQSRWPVRLPQPPDAMETITKRKRRTGFEHQLRLSMTGWASLRQVRIYCLPEPEPLGIDRMDES